MQMLLTARMPKGIALLLLGGVALAACDSGGGGSKNKTGINSLPSCFVQAFNRDENAEPIDASSCNLTVRPTRDPFNP